MYLDENAFQHPITVLLLSGCVCGTIICDDTSVHVPLPPGDMAAD